jgi:opacity protein-like surface antigen
MSKILIGTVAAVAFTSAAYAQDPAAPSANPFSVTLSADTSYNLDSEVTQTEFEGKVSVFGGFVGLSPTYNFTDQEVSDIELKLGYDIDVTDKLTVTPYGEYHMDQDFNGGDRIVGVKTQVTL